MQPIVMIGPMKMRNKTSPSCFTSHASYAATDDADDDHHKERQRHSQYEVTHR